MGARLPRRGTRACAKAVPPRARGAASSQNVRPHGRRAPAVRADRGGGCNFCRRAFCPARAAIAREPRWRYILGMLEERTVYAVDSMGGELGAETARRLLAPYAGRFR